MIRIDAAFADTAHPVFIGEGALHQLPDAPGRIAVVVDENVERLHGDRVRDAFAPHRPLFRTLPSGERHKRLATAEALYDWLAAIRLERGERVVAVGGGVTGDLAGFVAATWRRGVAFVQVPTTLLSQVDASVGGKVAIDLPAGKNLVGAFHPPSAVLIEPAFLETLPERELRAGEAEVVKTALLQGEPLASLLREGAASRAEVIAACVAFKAGVVAADPHEKGVRAILNLGHTLGHALEAAGGYERLNHGEAVSWGLRAALTLSGLPPTHLAWRLVERLPRADLSGIRADDLLAAMASDKKSFAGVPRFVLLDDLGKPRWNVGVAESEIRAVVGRLLAGEL